MALDVSEIEDGEKVFRGGSEDCKSNATGHKIWNSYDSKKV